MKRIINLLAETLALPYSDLFNISDPFAACAEKSKICDHSVEDGKRIIDLDKRLSETASDIAGYINRFLDIPNLTVLQGLIHYVFCGKNIVQCAEQYSGLVFPRWVMNQYYIDQLLKITNLLLTTRNGWAVLKPWDSAPQEDVFHAFDISRNAVINDASFFSPMRIELWNSLLRCFPEDLMLCSYSAVRAKETDNVTQARKDIFHMLLSFGDHIRMSDTLLDGMLEKGMAETHLHAGASRNFGIIWEAMLKDAVAVDRILENNNYALSYKPPIDEKDLLDDALDAAFIRVILAVYLQSGKRSLEEFLQEDILSIRYMPFLCMFARDVVQKGGTALHFSSIYQRGVPFWKESPVKDSFNLFKLLYLPEYMEKSCPVLAERCFLSWSLLYIQNKPEDHFYTALFLYYLRKKQKAYRMRVQDGKNKGLLYFQQFYSLSTDRGYILWDENISNLVFTALEDSRVKKTEFRFSPPISKAQTMRDAVFEVKKELEKYIMCFIREHLFAIVLKYSDICPEWKQNGYDLRKVYEQNWHLTMDNIMAGRKGELCRLLKKMKIMIDDIAPHRMGIIYHLIKKGEKAEGESCFAKEVNTERQKYEQLSFGCARFDYEAAVTAITDVRNNSPEISRLIVGIDAAALEIPTEPFVFAPAFRLAKSRNALWGCYENESNRKPLLGITYHVGEDFRHPFSGLRHIDEAFCGLGMHPGDRIGHGIALAMDMDRWFSLNGMAVMPRIERMENNIWIWHLMTTESSLSEVAKYANMTEKQILEDARTIYKDLHGVTVDNLYNAYSRKMLPVRELHSIVQKRRNDFNSNCRTCFKELEKASFFPCCENGDQVWHEDMLLLSYHCGLFKQRMNESVMAFTDLAQKEIAVAVQQYMLKKIAANGIVVETNPSSNTVIGEFDGILSHPVCHLRNERDYKVMATINTDDPSVFNATVANEHAQVYYAFLYNGYSTEEALKEVDTMRETALRTSFISSSVSINDMLKDYEEILKQII